MKYTLALVFLSGWFCSLAAMVYGGENAGWNSGLAPLENFVVKNEKLIADINARDTAIKIERMTEGELLFSLTNTLEENGLNTDPGDRGVTITAVLNSSATIAVPAHMRITVIPPSALAEGSVLDPQDIGVSPYSSAEASWTIKIREGENVEAVVLEAEIVSLEIPEKHSIKTAPLPNPFHSWSNDEGIKEQNICNNFMAIKFDQARKNEDVNNKYKYEFTTPFVYNPNTASCEGAFILWRLQKPHTEWHAEVIWSAPVTVYSIISTWGVKEYPDPNPGHPGQMIPNPNYYGKLRWE